MKEAHHNDTTPSRAVRRLPGLVFAILLLCAVHARAVTVAVPNGSFELPTTDYANPDTDGWEKAAQPPSYTDNDFLWNQLMGQFLNPAPGEPDRIDNVNGLQAAYLFARPDVAIFQDYDCIPDRQSTPTHQFTATYEPGKSYTLTIGVLGGGGLMKNGATLELALYHRTAGTNLTTIARTIVTNTPTLFPNNTHLLDFAVTLPKVKATDPWAGHHIGIRIASTVTWDLRGGYWDLDNIRLTSFEYPDLKTATTTNGNVQITLKGEPGTYELLTCTNLAAIPAQWAITSTLTNPAGTVSILDTNPPPGYRYYRVRKTP